MAIFYFTAQMIGRGDGRSAVSAAAYRSASRIENKYTGTIDDYSRKGWVEYSEIMLPANAPGKYQDRAVLWNTVEETEKGRNARLAREIVVALPKELTMQENIRLVQDYVRDTFVSEGMAADINIHNPPAKDKNGHPVNKDGTPVSDKTEMLFQNPHAHIMLTVRPFTEDGNWGNKSQIEYVCKRESENGGTMQIKSFTASEYKDAKQDGWQKQYQFYCGKQKVWLTAREGYERNLIRVSKTPKTTYYGSSHSKAAAWGTKEALAGYKKSWEISVNAALEHAGISEKVDCRSYADQGKDEVSGIHMGPYAARAEKSDRYKINEDIRNINRKNRELSGELEELEQEIAKRQGIFDEKVAERIGQIREDIILAQYQTEELESQKSLMDAQIQKIEESVRRVRTADENRRSKNQKSAHHISELKEVRAQKQIRKMPALWRRHREQAGTEEEIRQEQESIRFREQHFQEILKECGFRDIDDYRQKSTELSHLCKKRDSLAEKIIAFNDGTQENLRRLDKICGYADGTGRESPGGLTHESFCRSERKAADRIRKSAKEYRNEKFAAAVSKADYAISHSLYLAGRAGYLTRQIANYIDEQSEEHQSQRM